MTRPYVITTPAGRVVVRAHSIRHALKRAGLQGAPTSIVRPRR